jgi:hypothetical protein
MRAVDAMPRRTQRRLRRRRGRSPSRLAAPSYPIEDSDQSDQGKTAEDEDDQRTFETHQRVPPYLSWSARFCERQVLQAVALARSGHCFNFACRMRCDRFGFASTSTPTW